MKKEKNIRLNRWAKTGINIGSINIAGISMFKLFMLLEAHKIDVLCL